MTSIAVPLRATAPSRSNWFTQTGQVTRRWLISSIRQAWGPMMSLIQPVIWIVLFGQVFHSLGSLPQFGTAGYIDYLVPGILM
ncbi:MAG: ABC transporter permease, partial [Microbacterium sp.]|nr:ABC transporter permease [Microbacterium sp.]